MKFVILHGTSANRGSNWFPWLKAELEERGHDVWVPDLPNAERPDTRKYNELLLGSGYDFSDSVIIGHSSGSVAILGLLQELPEDVKIKAGVLVGAFTKRLSESPSWEMLQELFVDSFDFDAIKQKADQFIFVHSIDDPYCPIEDAKVLCDQLAGKFIEFKGMGHFSLSLDPGFDKFPELLEMLQRDLAA